MHLKGKTLESDATQAYISPTLGRGAQVGGCDEEMEFVSRFLFGRVHAAVPLFLFDALNLKVKLSHLTIPDITLWIPYYRASSFSENMMSIRPLTKPVVALRASS